jgi:hypothetical protein
VQGAQLLNDEEQEDDHRPSGVLEVLQALPQAHGAQGNKVGLAVQVRALTGAFLDVSEKQTGRLRRAKLKVGNSETGA